MVVEGNEYTYRMKPLVVPGIIYLVLYPLIVGAVCYIFYLPELCVRIFSAIYIVSALGILLIWLIGKSKKVIFEDNVIVFRSLFGQYVLEPGEIRRASFFWTPRKEEVVQIRAGKKVFYLSDLYFPFNELLTDLEQFIMNHNIRSNLSSHYGPGF